MRTAVLAQLQLSPAPSLNGTRFAQKRSWELQLWYQVLRGWAELWAPADPVCHAEIPIEIRNSSAVSSLWSSPSSWFATPPSFQLTEGLSSCLICFSLLAVLWQSAFQPVTGFLRCMGCCTLYLHTTIVQQYQKPLLMVPTGILLKIKGKTPWKIQSTSA